MAATAPVRLELSTAARYRASRPALPGPLGHRRAVRSMTWARHSCVEGSSASSRQMTWARPSCGKASPAGELCLVPRVASRARPVPVSPCGPYDSAGS
jgi:hypothetical protein